MDSFKFKENRMLPVVVYGCKTSSVPLREECRLIHKNIPGPLTKEARGN
jgi:hypothetical protein